MEGKVEQISAHTHFCDIENVLIKYISEAEKEILIAVAWFTNRNLFYHLLRAARRGLKVKLLTLYDRINVTGDLDFQMIVDFGGELYLSSSSKPILHNKYCIIDGKYVITGSYNFTYFAENVNSENIVVITSQEIVSRYTDNFAGLLRANDRVTDYAEYKSTHDYHRDIFASDVFAEIEDGYRYVDVQHEEAIVNEGFVISSPLYNQNGDNYIQRIVYDEGELIISFTCEVSGFGARCWIYSQNTRGVWRLESQSSNKVYEAFKISNLKADDKVILDITEPDTCYHLNAFGLYQYGLNSDTNNEWIKTPKKYIFSCDIHFNIQELDTGMFSLYEGDEQMRKSPESWNILNIDLNTNQD